MCGLVGGRVSCARPCSARSLSKDSRFVRLSVHPVRGGYARLPDFFASSVNLSDRVAAKQRLPEGVRLRFGNEFYSRFKISLRLTSPKNICKGERTLLLCIVPKSSDASPWRSFTPFNSPVRLFGARLFARPPLPFDILHHPGGGRARGRRDGRLEAKNYTPVAITISPADAAVFWSNCHCAFS